MEINTMVELINTMGFPIVVCGVLFWFIKNTLSKHQTLMEQFVKAIDNNTDTIKLLVQKLQDK